MPKARSAERDKAKELWMISGKIRLLKDIAAELGVPENKVRKWKSVDKWENGTFQKKDDDKGNAPNENAPKKKRGAQPNNKNSVGNKGGAPEGNKNDYKHGLYETLYWDSLDEEEYSLIALDVYQKEEQQLIEQLKLLTVRERRLMKSIKEYKEKENGLALKSVIRRNLTIDGNIVTGDSQTQKETTTRTIASFDVIMRLESELTKVQARKTRCIESLQKVRIEAEKMDLFKLKLGLGDDDVLIKAKELLGVIDSAF